MSGTRNDRSAAGQATVGGVSGRERRRVLGALGIALVVAATVVATAAALTAQQRPAYTSEAVIVLDIPATGVARAPAMGTEREIASSRAIAEAAASELREEVDDLLERLHVSVPVETNALHVEFEAGTPSEAQRGAAAFTRAYVDYRTRPTLESPLPPVAMSIVSPADLPTEPSTPSWPVNLAAGAVLGLLLGGAVAYPQLARARRGAQEQSPVAAVEPPDLLAVVPAPPLELLPLRGRPEQDVEAYRRLRAHLLAAPSRSPITPLMLASARDGSATASVAAQLAVSLVHAGHRTVLVAAETDRRALRAIGIAGDAPGMTSALVAALDPVDLLLPTELEGLALLPPGDEGVVSDLVAQFGLADVLRRLSSVADVVLVDAGGVLTSATALEAAAHVPHVLLVVDGVDGDVETARRELDRRSARVVGTVRAVPARGDRLVTDLRGQLRRPAPQVERPAPGERAVPLPTARRPQDGKSAATPDDAAMSGVAARDAVPRGNEDG